MKKSIKVSISLVLFVVTVLLSTTGVYAQDKIVMSDFYLPFEVYQGEGDVSVVLDAYSEEINSYLILEKFDKLTYKDNEVDEKYYEISDVDNLVKITLKEEYLRTFDDDTYYFDAVFERIDIGLKLCVITEKATVKDVVYKNTWNGKESAGFVISGIDYPLGADLIEYISLNGKKLDENDYVSNFMGNSGFVAITKDYLDTLPAGTYIFDVEFLSVSGIKLELTIPDFYCKGDADGNGNVTAADARLVLRASAKLEKLTAEATACCDVNNDNVINSSDARKILRASAKLESF